MNDQVATRERQVPAQLNMLSADLEALAKVIDDLTKRLIQGGVLTPSPSGIAKESNQENLVGVAMRIVENRRKVQVIMYEVGTILENLEV